MKSDNAKIIITSSNNRKKEFEVLLMTENDKYNYVIYTERKKNKEGEMEVYLGKYLNNTKNPSISNDLDEKDKEIFNKLLNILSKDYKE